MTSIVIHMSVANEVSKKRKIKNYNEFLLGSIAPDISKIVGWSRDLSHFIDSNTTYPDIDKFLKKYKLDNEIFLYTRNLLCKMKNYKIYKILLKKTAIRSVKN